MLRQLLRHFSVVIEGDQRRANIRRHSTTRFKLSIVVFMVVTSGLTSVAGRRRSETGAVASVKIIGASASASISRRRGPFAESGASIVIIVGVISSSSSGVIKTGVESVFTIVVIIIVAAITIAVVGVSVIPVIAVASVVAVVVAFIAFVISGVVVGGSRASAAVEANSALTNSCTRKKGKKRETTFYESLV